MGRAFWAGSLTLVALAFAACGDDGGGSETPRKDAGTDASLDASSDAADASEEAEAEAEAASPGPTAGECGAVTFSKAWGGGAKGSLFSLERALDVVVDGQGHPFVTGAYYGDIDFGGGALVAGGSNRSMFVLELDDKGSHVSSRGFGDSSGGVLYAPQATGHAIALRPGGGVVVAGSFAGSVDFGTGTPLLSAEQGGLDAGFCFACFPDIVVLALDAQHSTLWAKRWGDVDGDSAMDVAVAPNGAIFAAGSFTGTLDFGTGSPLVSAGKADAFVVKLDASGTPLWAKRFGGPGDDVANAVLLEGASVRVAGATSGGADFGSGPSSIGGESDAFLVSLAESDGLVTGGRVLGASQRGGLMGLALGASGSVLVSGWVRGTLSFAGKSHGPTHANDVLIAAFDAAGKELWARVAGTSENDSANGVEVVGGGVLVTGSAGGGQLDLGGGPLLGNYYYDSAFVLELDSSGAHVCSRRWLADSLNEPIGDAATLGASIDGLGIAVASSGAVWVVGALTGKSDVGAGAFQSSGGTDVLVVRTEP